MSSRSRWGFLGALILVVLALGAISYFAFQRNTGSQTITITPHVATVTGTGVTATFSVTTATSIGGTTSSTNVSSNRSLSPHITFGGILFVYDGSGRQDVGEPNLSDITVASVGARTWCPSVEERILQGYWTRNNDS